MSKTVARRQRRKKLNVEMTLMNLETGETVKGQTELATSDEQMEAEMIVDRLAFCYKRSLDFYRTHCKLPDEDARAQVDAREELAEYERSLPTREIHWYHLDHMAQRDMKTALEAWKRIRLCAVEDFESGTIYRVS
jgi:hypothetical protein